MTKMATMYPFRMRVANKKPQKTKNEADGNAVWIVWATAWPLGAKKKQKKNRLWAPIFLMVWQKKTCYLMETLVST